MRRISGWGVGLVGVGAFLSFGEWAAGDEGKLAEGLGLVSQVTADAQGVFAVYEGAKFWGEIEESGLGQSLLKALEESEAVPLGGQQEQLRALLGEEVLVAVGKGTEEQAEVLSRFSRWSNRVQMETMVRMFDLAVGDEGGGGLGNANAMLRGLQNDPDFLVNLIAAAKMPPVLIACRVKDEEVRMGMAMGLQAMLGMAVEQAGGEGGMLRKEDFEAGGVQFAGVRVNEEQVLMMVSETPQMRQGLEGLLGAAATADLLGSLEGKTVTLAAGVSGDALYLFLGDRSVDIPLADEGEETLVGSGALDEFGAYLDEDLLTVTWMSKELVEASAGTGEELGGLAEGLATGLMESSSLGATRKAQESLKRVSDLEAGLYKGREAQEMHAATFVRADGLYMETHGGMVPAGIDWEEKHTLGAAKGAFLTGTWVSDADYEEASVAFLEGVSAAVYELALVVAKYPDLDAEGKNFAEAVKVFDAKMKEDAVSLWSSFVKANEGLGREVLLEIDLAGTMPRVPEVPEVILDGAPMPRLSLVMPVQDQAVLGESWKEMEKSVSGLLAAAGELSGEKIPMQKPMSSQMNEVKTYFYSLPTQTDDFVPSVTVSPQVLVLGTSKNRAVEVAQAAATLPEERRGLWMELEVEPLRAFLAKWLGLAEAHPEEIFEGGVEEAQEFLENYGADLKEAIEGLREIEGLTSHSRMEEGVLRTTMVLRTN
ncbi:MAG: hypothetical protein AAGC74_07250 [Verrucomicrobiota bacterium]